MKYLHQFHGSDHRCKWSVTLYELQVLDELDLFGCVHVKVSEGRVGRESEALHVFYGLHESKEGERHKKIHLIIDGPNT